MSRRSALGRVRGLGSAREGVGHWWAERLTAVALVPLALWFAVSVAALAGADHAAVAAWMGSPVVAGLLILLIFATMYHAYLGLQVVIEDYVHHEGWKLALLLFVQAFSILLVLTALLSILTVLF